MASLLRLVFWGGLWLVAWVFTTLLRKIRRKARLDNCLTWSIRRWDAEGGYLVVRWGRSARYHWMRWPHFLWLPEDQHEHLRHFLPRDDKHDQVVLPAPWFEGYVQKGDPKDVIEN